jgi:hypothetical protein
VTGTDGDGKSGDGSGRRKEVGQFESPMPFLSGHDRARGCRELVSRECKYRRQNKEACFPVDNN